MTEEILLLIYFVFNRSVKETTSPLLKIFGEKETFAHNIYIGRKSNVYRTFKTTKDGEEYIKSKIPIDNPLVEYTIKDLLSKYFNSEDTEFLFKFFVPSLFELRTGVSLRPKNQPFVFSEKSNKKKRKKRTNTENFKHPKSPQHLQKMTEANRRNREERNNKISETMKGQKQSEETRRLKSIKKKEYWDKIRLEKKK